MNVKLSTLAIALGLIAAAPQAYGLANPKGLAEWARKFPRHIPIGVALMGIGTAWFIYNLSLESIADFATFKQYMMLAFAGIGIATCIVVHDFLAVRGLAIVFLCLAKLMVDTGRPHLGDTSWTLVIQTWAYVFVVAGIWLTISPWRFRDWLSWNTATAARIRNGCIARLAFSMLVIALGVTVFRKF